MGHDKDEDRCALDGLEDLWYGDNVLGQLNVWQVANVLVCAVDDLGQLAAVDRLLVHPHVDRLLKQAAVLRVLAHDARDGAAPVARAQDADAFLGHGRRGRGGRGLWSEVSNDKKQKH